MLLLFISSNTAFATSIVAVRNDNEIVIGADSKTMLTGGDGSRLEPESIEKCKIVQVGNLFFASAGSAGIGSVEFFGNTDPEFNMKEAIAKGLGGKGDIADKVKKLERVLVGNLTQIAEKARQDNAAFMLKRFVNQPIHTVLIAGSDNNDLVLMVRTFNLIVSPSGYLSFEIGRYSCPGDCREPSIAIFEGKTEAIRNYLQENGYFLNSMDPAIAVRDLVGLEISKEPSSVGPPVDILRLTRKGAEWIQRKPLCPDIREDTALPDEGSEGR